MKYVLVLIVIVNFENMELVHNSYSSKEECMAQIPIIKQDVKLINKNLYPLEISSITCMPEKPQ